MQHTLNAFSLSRLQSIQHLVENRKAYTLNRCERNVFVTYTQSSSILVNLKALLMRMMQSQNLRAAGKSGRQKPLGPVITYNKDNLTENISMDTLNSQACRAKAILYRFCKRELEMSRNDLILSEKMVRAKQLLSNIAAKITAVSYEPGFTDANYFIKAFKKNVGIRPGMYHQQALKSIVH
jgi:AraC-like DNA-binding protein